MGDEREERGADAEDRVLLQQCGRDPEGEDRRDGAQDRPADEQQPETPARQTDDRERGSDADVSTQRGRGSFPTPESGEQRPDLSPDGGQPRDITDERPADEEAGEPTGEPLQQVRDEHGDAGPRTDGERDIRGSGVPRPDRPGVGPTGQPGGDHRARDTSNDVGDRCSQSSESELQWLYAVIADFGRRSTSATIRASSGAQKDVLQRPARPLFHVCHGMNVLAVSNQKGGVGKTTTAISLAAALVEMGSRVLLVDLDPQGNATSGLGIGKEQPHSVYGVLVRGEPLTEAVQATGVPGLDLLPSSLEMAGAEVELVPLMAREFRLREALQREKGYDTVLIDCPPSLGLLTVNALAAADAVLVPVQCEYYALEGLAQLLSTIDAVRVRLNTKLEVLAIVLTMEDRRNRLSMQVTEEVIHHFPDLVARVRIPRAVRLAEGPSHRQPISV